MKELRILITGVGRRIELIQAFRQAALTLDISLKIFGADMTGTAPALAYCDFTRKVCGMRDPNYIDELVKICKTDKIDLVMPTIDTDLLVLSQNVFKLEEIGTKVLISKPDKVLICRDKNNTGEFFESCGVKAPKTYNEYLKYDDIYPCFIKPKDGSSSINAYKVEDFEELEVYAKQIDDYIVQPFIDGPEYTVDIFCDFDGKPLHITPRKRVQVRAGEVLKTEIYMNETIINECKRIIAKFKPCGPMTVQLIKNTKTNENYYIEINPRYGGGAPLSMKAGARSAETLLLMLSGKTVQDITYDQSDGAIYSRFDQSVCIETGHCKQPLKGIIFDLDDTLFSEKEYIKSGYKKIAEYLESSDAQKHLWEYFEKNMPAIDCYLRDINCEDKREKCLEVYRKQIPTIHLYEGVEQLITQLKNRDLKIGIITDGRAEGQRNKIKALGLDSLVDDIIITDELGGIQFRKPNDISFRIIQNRWRIPFEQIAYIGDNSIKDFQGPKQLGMQTMQFINDDGIYSSKTEIVTDTFNDISLLKKCLFSRTK